MLNMFEVIETNDMIDKDLLDVRTITIGISLLDCIDKDLNKLCKNIYDKITNTAKDLVRVGDEISKDCGVPIVNKNIGHTYRLGGWKRLQDKRRLCTDSKDT